MEHRQRVEHWLGPVKSVLPEKTSIYMLEATAAAAVETMTSLSHAVTDGSGGLDILKIFLNLKMFKIQSQPIGATIVRCFVHSTATTETGADDVTAWKWDDNNKQQHDDGLPTAAAGGGNN